MSLKKKTISGIKWTSTSTVLVTALRFLQLAILARLLSPSDFGLMAIALIAMDIVFTNIDLGVSAGIIQKQNVKKDELSSLYWLNIFVGIIFFVIFYFIRPLISLLFKEPALSEILFWISVSFLIKPLGSQFKVLLQKDLKFEVIAKQEIVGKSSEAVLSIILAVKGFGVWSLVFGYLFGISVNTIIVLLYGITRYRPSLHFKLKDIKNYLSFGIYQMGTRTVGLLSEKLDQIIIGGMLGAQNLGYYSFAYNMANQPISRISPVLMHVLFPVFSKIQNDIEKLRKGYLKAANILMTMLSPLAFGLIVISHRWVVPIFGEKWSESILLIQIIAFVALLKGPGKTHASLALAKGKVGLLFNWTVTFTIYRCIFIVIGGKLYGIAGVAIFLLISQIGLLIPSYYYLVMPFIGNCWEKYIASVFKPVLLSGIMAIGVIFITKYYSSSLWYLSGDIAFGGVFYILLLLIFDRKNLLNILTMGFKK